MKETPLHKAFEDALRKISSDPAQQKVAQDLAVLQQTVLDFQEAGVPMTLTVRPDKTACPLLGREEIDGLILANGAIEAGDIRLDFVIQKEGYYEDQMSLNIFSGDKMVLERVAHFDEDREIWRDDAPENDDDEEYEDEPARDEWSRRVATDNWGTLPPEEEDRPAGQKPPRPPSDLKSVLTALLVDLKAHSDFVTRYNVGPNGLSGAAVEKPFTVPGQLKLKKPGSP